MRLPCVRITSRQMMTVIAIVAAGLWSWKCWERRELCLRRAALHDAHASSNTRAEPGLVAYATQLREVATSMRSNPALPVYIPDVPPDSDRPATIKWIDDRCAALDKTVRDNRASADKSLRYAARFRRVARMPWLPSPDDSP